MSVTPSMEYSIKPLLRDGGWRVKSSGIWDVLGPFPIHAREQHFLSPSFPINLSDPIDYSKSWSSSYADGGLVKWTKFKSNDKGDLKVSFPGIRWTVLRATEGWAALQHHSVLKTSITVFPPSEVKPDDKNFLRLHVQLVQGSFFTVLPSTTSKSDPLVPKWYSGNIYDIEQAPAQILDFPVPPSATSPTTYDIFVSGDYEIRLFGDPRTYSNSDTPVLSINLTVQVERAVENVVWDSTQDVTCDVVDGFAFGDALGFGLRSVDGWWTVKDVRISNDHIDGVSVRLLHKARIAPTQTRIVPIRLFQSKPIAVNELLIKVVLGSETSSIAIMVSLPIRHLPRWTSTTFRSIKASYFFAKSMPTSFIVLPPIEQNDGKPCPPILALHGAGVKILEQNFWADSLPRQKRSWVVIPTGRTSWGLDWHGPSTEDAWASVDALFSIVENNTSWHPWKLAEHTSVVLIGHSNGGQGAWYMASRYPDRVLAVVPAAAYIKSQSYVPLTMSRSARFIDPALRAILDTALTADDNDLFLSNMVDTPVFAIHGGNDDNVPTWHSRQAVDVLKSWNPNADVSYYESPDQPHWWPSVFKNDAVQSFINEAILKSMLGDKARSKAFTLTVAIPSESGSLHGWKIESLEVPGRLAQLHVEDNDGIVKVQTTNVHTFSVNLRIYSLSRLLWDGQHIIVLPEIIDNVFIRYIRKAQGTNSVKYQTSGRMQAVLTTAAPVALIVPDHAPLRNLSIALRIAHDLNKYCKLDSEVIQSSEALQRCQDDSLGPGNMVVVGDSQTPFTRWCMTRQHSVFDINVRPLKLNGRSLEGSSGILFLHQHPVHQRANVLFMLGDDSGIERAARLFPIRTGITTPDWLVIGTRIDHVGTAGLIGAGVWARWWEWDDRSSWLH